MAERRDHFDCVVVGGGSAGCVLAARLSEDPNRSVLLLECGPDFASREHFPHVLLGRNEQWVEDYFTWKYPAQLTDDPDSTGTVIRGRVIGGSSSVNGGVFLRGLPEDFELWNSPEWSWEHVVRCYKRSETDHDFANALHGDSGPIPVKRVARRDWTPLFEAFYRACCDAGLNEAADLNDPTQTGVGPIPRNYYGGIRVNAAMAYLDPARGRPNLEVRGNALVSRVLMEGTRATGVELIIEGVKSTINADLVIVSAGALATPAILMRSGIGPATHLQRLGIPVACELPGVGAHLQDHSVVKLELKPRSGRPTLRPEDPGRFQSLLVHSASHDFRNDIHVMPAYFPDVLVLAPSLNFGIGSGLLEIVSDDPTVDPRIHYNYLAEPSDLRRLLEATGLAIELATSVAMGEVADDLVSPNLDERSSPRSLELWLRKNIISSFHSSGTCRLGPANQVEAVVDDQCRVHGIDGLRIADLSIMPNTIRANTNAAAIMIGERVAEMIGALPSPAAEAAPARIAHGSSGR